MTQSIWPTPEEVEELTAFKYWKRQGLALAQMGVPFMLNRVGRPLVERAAVLRYPREGAAASAYLKAKPNWDAIRKPRLK